MAVLRCSRAHPNRIHLYAPQGVYIDDDVVVADSGNHRALIWYGWPENDHAPADIVLCCFVRYWSGGFRMDGRKSLASYDEGFTMLTVRDLVLSKSVGYR